MVLGSSESEAKKGVADPIADHIEEMVRNWFIDKGINDVNFYIEKEKWGDDIYHITVPQTNKTKSAFLDVKCNIDRGLPNLDNVTSFKLTGQVGNGESIGYKSFKNDSKTKNLKETLYSVLNDKVAL